jgi:hypothetical protein
MIELMQEYSGASAVIIGTIIYLIGMWRGSKSPSESLISETIHEAVVHTTDQLIEEGYICTNEVERDGKMISVIVPYEEYIQSKVDKNL